MAGIGCHFMTIWMDRATEGFTQMGGEGVPWVGQQPFSHEKHIFANLGDGTYFHSGLLAVRQSIAAGVNITYKILYNDAVAMTGGQQVGERAEGHSVLQIANSMRAEGAVKIVIVTDEPEKYDALQSRGAHTGLTLPEGIRIEHRDELDRIQREFREIDGTTVIIYDQTCATEKRRRRKRGTMVDPAMRVVINELVCEGCGDCSVQSNCVSVEPLETEFGRKRQINQSTCNKDVSCVNGFCPSFVTVEGGKLRKKAGAAKSNAADAIAASGPAAWPELPPPPKTADALSNGAVWGTIVAGVGGTGVITIGQLLGVAAHLEGKGIVTQDAGGLAQKGGATWSHVLIGATQDDIRTTRVGMACADLVIGCDPIVVAGKETLLRMRPGRTHVALNSNSTPTAAFVRNADWQNPAERCVADVAAAVGHDGVGTFDADALSTQMLGDSIYTNPMMLGFAWQKGWIPLGLDSLMRAIELNAVAVDNNKQAFEWGRRAAEDWPAVKRALAPAQVIAFTPRDKQAVETLVQRRVDFLMEYQNAAYALSYRAFVHKVHTAELALVGATGAAVALPLTEAVARYLFKLMAYKDEYEVARLHADRVFEDKLHAMFEGDFKIHHYLAPPMVAATNARGELQKSRFGPWMRTVFRFLAPLKVLRGTAFDPFGRTRERREERALILQYRADIEALLPTLTLANREALVALARVPEQIRGFGHVKARHIVAARAQRALLKSRCTGEQAPPDLQQAA
jgi:indolepyruvate ferredoxin oxidoreductase